MNTLTRSFLLILVFLAISAVQNPATAQKTVENPDVTLKVDGLACPICAYGLEKSLKKIETIEAVSVHIQDGEVRVKGKEHTSIPEIRIREAVVDAGFTLIRIDYKNKKADEGADL